MIWILSTEVTLIPEKTTFDRSGLSPWTTMRTFDRSEFSAEATIIPENRTFARQFWAPLFSGHRTHSCIRFSTFQDSLWGILKEEEVLIPAQCKARGCTACIHTHTHTHARTQARTHARTHAHKWLGWFRHCITGTAPSCLCDCLQLYTPSRTLRSTSDSLSFQIPRTRLSIFGSSAFSVSVSSTWNDLPFLSDSSSGLIQE